MTNFLIGYPDIPQNSTIATSETQDSSYPTKNLITGSRGKYHQLASATTNSYYIQCDRTSTASSQYVAIQRANLLKQGNCQAFSLHGSTQPYSGFGSPTLWLDATRSIMFDSLNRVSSWATLAGSVNAFTQSTDDNKPVLSRADNRENLLRYSEEMDNAAWTLVAANSVIANAVANPLDGQVTADRIRENSAFADHYIYQGNNIGAGTSYTISCYLKSNGRNARIIASGAAISPSAILAVDLSNGSILSSSGGTAYSVDSLGDGWYRANCTFTATGSGNCDFNIRLLNGSTAVYLGDGSSGVYAYGAQLRRASTDSTYTLTTSIAAWSGVNGLRALVFDGSNDQLNSSSALSAIITNSAFTILYVSRLNVTPSVTFGLLEDRNGRLTTGVASNEYYVQNDDGGGADFVDTGVNPSTNTTYVHTLRHESGNLYIQQDNGTAVSVASGNTTSLTGTLDVGSFFTGNFWNGYICEILVYNTALSAGDRTTAFEYLRDKWQTAPAAYTDAGFTGETLYGPRGEDWISSFSTTTAYRYWYGVYAPNTSSGSKFPHSKLHFGSWFDFGREPLYPMLQKREAYSSGSREARYIFECEWQGITDAIAEDFIDKIVKYKDVSPVVLYDAGDYCLNDMRSMHAWLTRVELDKAHHNSNTIRCTFEEAL